MAVKKGKSIKKEAQREETAEKVDFLGIEKKWQKEWEKTKIFEAKEDPKKKKFYCLEMFPYPSASGLHMGHAFNFTIGDIYARFKKLNGFNVLHPIGFDSLGLPAENAAIKEGVNPKDYTETAIKNFEKQFRALGISYDWSRAFRTHDPSYYKWDQWIFLQMLKKGIAFRKKAPVNWCPKCNTVLANEEVAENKCWRCKSEVMIKHLEQWFFGLSAYAEDLLKGLDGLDWPERIKAMQRNWIGKSEGTRVLFKLKGSDKNIEVFTTRSDTLYGVMFLVAAAQNELVSELVKGTKYEKEYQKFMKNVSTSEKFESEKGEGEKEGFFTGKYAVHPLTGGDIPIWASNFVVADYGTGVVMAVPAHDQRDFEFARKYKIPIKLVIQRDDKKLDVVKMKEAYQGLGILVNSGPFNDLNSEEAKEHITKALEEKGLGGFTTEYKLKDWLVSRQRYWGTPIPIIYCDKCGVVPVPEKDLPVELPEKVEFGKGNPLLTSKEFVNVKCPDCHGKAKRETDTMSTFVNSSWYFLRYCDPDNSKEIFKKDKVKYWMPIDFYIGGAEHACMHLIYFRFYTKFLKSIGLTDINEPATRLFNQGMVHGSDGAVMSKSRGNVVDPLSVISKYGTDTLRLYLVSNAFPDKDFAWSDESIPGSFRFVNRFYRYVENAKIGKSSERVESKVNKAIKEVTDDLENLRYSLAVIKFRTLLEAIETEQISQKDLESFIKILNPICPHITEELWHKWNKTLLSDEQWPKADEKKINEKLEEMEKNFNQTICDVQNILKIIKEKTGKEGNKIYLYTIPNEVKNFNPEELGKKLSKEVWVFGVNDKKKYDPQNKARKAKFGKPAIYIE